MIIQMSTLFECLQVTGPVNAHQGEMEEVVGAGRGPLTAVQLFHSHQSALAACAVSSWQ